VIPLWLRKIVGYPVLQYKRRDFTRFCDNLKHSQEIQARRLNQILDLLRGSQFAKDFGLTGIRTPEEFRRALGVAPYERMAPYIERLKKGEFTALFRPGIDVKMFAMTSGTTHAPKFIPVTSESLAEYRKTWAIWGCGLAEDHPVVPFSGVINLASGYRVNYTEAGIPCGSISGLIVAVMHANIRLTSCLPPEVADVSASHLRQYLALRLSLPRRDTMMVTTANPSTLISFAKRLDRDKEQLIRDLADGTLFESSHYPKDVLQKISRRIREKHRFLARALEQLASEGPLYPKKAWPHLSVTGVWTGGTLGAYLPELPKYYGETALRDHGLSASEGRMTIPLQDGCSAGILNIEGSFFEFMPVDSGKKSGSETLLAHELDVGAHYNLVVTTSGGLIRYDMQDIVECTGYVGNTPLLRFLHKGSQISSLTGEKISSWQVTEAVRYASESLGIVTTEFTVAPQYGDPSRYFLLIEDQRLPPVSVQSSLARLIDDRLMTFNIEYRDKRTSNRLGPLQVLAIQDGTFATIMSESIASRGTPPEHYKHPFLIQDLDFIRRYAFHSLDRLKSPA
jgi:hypothetical protein